MSGTNDMSNKVLKILVVDDEIAVCKQLRKFLESKGYSVVEAHSGDEALSVYKKERPDVVLLDIRMPRKDGLETLRELMVLDPKVKVIMVTAVLERELAGQADVEKALNYIAKPINLEHLELVLETQIVLRQNGKLALT